MNASDQTGSVTTKKIGLGLGYFSIALGLLEVAAPGQLARWLGVENKTAKNTIFGFGIRELLAGGALLRGPAVSTNVWSRVIGDVIDLGALGVAGTKSSRPMNVALAGGFVAGALVADFLTARALDKKTGQTFTLPSRGAGRGSRPDDGASRSGGFSGKARNHSSGEDVTLTNLRPADLAAV